MIIDEENGPSDVLSVWLFNSTLPFPSESVQALSLDVPFRSKEFLVMRLLAKPWFLSEQNDQLIILFAKGLLAILKTAIGGFR